jgi:hypothetical protein
MGLIAPQSHLGPYLKIVQINMSFISFVASTYHSKMIFINLNLHYVWKLPSKFNFFWFNGSYRFFLHAYMYKLKHVKMFSPIMAPSNLWESWF